MFRTTAAAAALAAAALAAPAAPAFAEDVSASIVAGHPPVFRWVKMFPQAFIPEVERRLEGTGHSMRFDEQYGGAVAKVGEELEAVEEGLAEIGAVSSLFDPAKLTLQNVTYYTPFVSDDADLVTQVMDALQREDARMQAIYDQFGIVQIGGPIAIDDYLLMTTFPVTSLADLEGRKIAAPGAAINWLSGTGAVGVSGNLTLYYNDIKTGVYDGVLVFASAALPGKLYEVAPHITKVGLGAQYAGSIGVNKDWWEDLPQEVRDAMLAGAEAYKAAYLADLDATVKKAFEVMAANGATIKDASPEMRRAWAAGMDNVAKEWAGTLDARGQPGSAILSTYMDAMRAAGATPLRDWDKE
ncbi:C4-dicarboxylate TRAP transporter substrate-binding protein [Rhodovulum sp. DZ06]|uniref:C4-dicarboxylate TRAP transporter substrate-binding protein n=1 Tax=Rhodovulum sp. DZ06 TaxID=3425126 RepID=UPI003D356212